MQKEIDYRKRKTKIDLPTITPEQSETLNTILNNSKNPGYQITDAEIDLLLNFLGEINPDIRDKTVFFSIANLTRSDAFSDQQIEMMLEYLLNDDILSSHIFEPENDGIFLRSFAILIIGALLQTDQQFDHQLDESYLNYIILKIATYAIIEKDGRGFVDEKGWAHVLTHLGNILDVVSQSNIGRGTKLFLFTAVIFCYTQNSGLLGYGEGKRIAFSIFNLIKRDDFYDDYFVQVLEQWVKTKDYEHIPVEIEFWNKFYNQMNLIDSLVSINDLPEKTREFIKNNF